MCRDIIDNGTDTRGEKVRTGMGRRDTSVYDQKFGVVNRYDLSKEFPALTLREPRLKAVRMNFSGSGSRNQIISMTCTAISGTAGQMKTDRSEKLTDIRWA